MTDFIILAVVAVIGFGGCAYLLREAKRYRARKSGDTTPPQHDRNHRHAH